MRRWVRIIDENLYGEVLSEQTHGAIVKYSRGGFEYTEYMSAEDYEYIDDFEYFVEDEE